MASERLICFCKQVSEKEIRRLLHRHPAAAFADIQLATGAGTGCGRCKPEMTRLLEAHRKQHPGTPQLRLPFRWGDE